MAFILGADVSENAKDDFVLLKSRFADYRKYLESVREKLPLSAYEFAVAEWHYNSERHECPHDAWVESLVVSEPFSGERREKRSLEIRVRLLGAFHDGYIDLRYKSVQSYSLETPAEFKMLPLNVGHGDWLKDEIRLSESGSVLHEVEFSRGSKWLIECEDIVYRWSPFEV
jgi:hypothetical protein